MLTPHQYVVCLGLDAMLLRTRRELLQNAGHEVITTSDLLVVAELLLKGEVSILVLCHTLSAEDAAVISRFHRDTSSTAMILALTTGLSESVVECLCHVCEMQKGPAAFVAAVTKLSNLRPLRLESFRLPAGVVAA